MSAARKLAGLWQEIERRRALVHCPKCGSRYREKRPGDRQRRCLTCHNKASRKWRTSQQFKSVKVERRFGRSVLALVDLYRQGKVDKNYLVQRLIALRHEAGV